MGQTASGDDLSPWDDAALTGIRKRKRMTIPEHPQPRESMHAPISENPTVEDRLHAARALLTRSDPTQDVAVPGHTLVGNVTLEWLLSQAEALDRCRELAAAWEQS